ncbi:MAG TPA: prephenate dehydrogenase [Planctomycetota bacterium]|jgi:prephenate dehydrogenase|nr:prephenate dehydrogenase [Planctomycetota bacterium]
MRTPTVAVVGLGQIGGSLAGALTRGRLARVVGVTRSAETARRARRRGWVAEAGTDLAAVSSADVVVLATPVRTLLAQIPQVASLVRPGALLTDVGSTKAAIVGALARHARRGPAVGGHPMAGNERAGLDGADPELFRNRPWILVPASPGARRSAGLLERLVRDVGARPIWMEDPREHDLAVARVSHVPHLIAYALAEEPDGAVRVAGNSYRDATRVALADVEMCLDFLLTNRASVGRAAREFGRRLAELARLVERGDEEALRKRLHRARERRQSLKF